MFVQIIAPLAGILFISLGLINLSSTINPTLHSHLNEHLKQIQENSPGKYIRDFPFNRLKTIFSIYLIICGFVLQLCDGIKRLFFVIPLSILSIYMVQLTIIYGLNISNSLIYIFLLGCILIILFNDCAELDDLEIK